MKQTENKPPKTLGKRASAFWRELDAQFIFEAADLQRLLIVCQSIDVIDQCQAEIDKHGMFTTDRYGGRRQHPAVVVQRDARQLLLRSLRELCVDIEAPEEPRLPRQGRRYA